MARCFGETITGQCSALDVSKCDKESCAFYKSVEQAKADYRRAECRCKKLGIPSNGDYVIWKKAKDLADQKMAEIKS